MAADHSIVDHPLIWSGHVSEPGRPPLSVNRQQRRAQERRERKGGDQSASSHFATALQHQRAGRLDDAEAGCRAALRIAPAHAPSLELLGVLLCQQGRFEEAEPMVRQLVQSKPGDPAKLDMLGVVLYQLNRLGEAQQVLARAIALRPEDAECHNHLAEVLGAQGETAAAVASCTEACRLEPENPIRHFNLGCALQADQRHTDAAASFRAAIRLKADFADAYSNLAVVLRVLGDCDAAFAACRRALALLPDDADFRTNLWHLLLLTGQFEEGWREYEWRLKQKKGAIRLRGFTQPLWRGEALGERVLLLHAEQGLGDTIQFCRYAPIAAERNRVVLIAPQALVRLLSGLEGVQRVIASGDKLPDYDVHCPLMSLPRVFGTTLDTVPAKVPYLQAAPAAVAAWRRRLADLGGLKVGLVWSAAYRPLEPVANLRSMTLERLAPLASLPGATFVSLQKGEAAAQLGALPGGAVIHDWTAELDDFADTAALVESLDLVISVDTSVAHLAGALGKPVWLLARSDACWRWLLDRQDSPWYPTLRLFRQPGFGDWDAVVRQVRSALERVLQGREPLRPGGIAGSLYMPAGT